MTDVQPDWEWEVLTCGDPGRLKDMITAYCTAPVSCGGWEIERLVATPQGNDCYSTEYTLVLRRPVVRHD